jgi:hypothetical protein
MPSTPVFVPCKMSMKNRSAGGEDASADAESRESASRANARISRSTGRQRVLGAQPYGELGKRERGLVRAYLDKVTGRLIRVWLNTAPARPSRNRSLLLHVSECQDNAQGSGDLIPNSHQRNEGIEALLSREALTVPYPLFS